jgi:hypothetical protein
MLQDCYHMVSETGKGKPLYASTYLRNEQASVTGNPDQGAITHNMLATPGRMHRVAAGNERRHAGRLTTSGDALVVENDCGRQRDPERHVAIAQCCL